MAGVCVSEGACMAEGMHGGGMCGGGCVACMVGVCMTGCVCDRGHV